MSDSIISPVPYGGGSVVTSQTSRDLIFVNNSYTKWVYAFRQTSPNYSYLGLVEISPSLNHPSPTITYVKQKAYLGNSWSNPKIYKISNNRIMVTDISQSNLLSYIYDISGNDFIKVASGNLPLDSSSTSKPTQYAVVEESDNSFYWLVLLSSSSTSVAIRIRRITFNDGDTSFTVSSPLTTNNSIGGAINTIRYKQISTNEYMIFGLSSNQLRVVSKFDKSTFTITNTTLPAHSGYIFAIFSPGEMIYIYNIDNYFRFDGSNYSSIYQRIAPGSLEVIYDMVEMENYDFAAFRTVNFTPISYQLFRYNNDRKKVITAFRTFSPVSLPALPANVTYKLKSAANNNASVFRLSPTNVMYVAEYTNDVKWIIKTLSFE